MTVIQEAATCSTCDGSTFTRHGLDRHGVQRWKCSKCGRTYTGGFKSGVPKGIRVSRERLLSFLLTIGRGQSIRKSAKACGINRNTGCHIVRVIRIAREPQNEVPVSQCPMRRVEREKSRLEREKLMLDRRETQRLEREKKATPSWLLEESDCNLNIDDWQSHIRLAVDVASKISERNTDDYLGPIYEGIKSGLDGGVTEANKLRVLGWESLKSHWKEMRLFGRCSLDAMKASTGYEFATYDEEPEW